MSLLRAPVWPRPRFRPGGPPAHVELWAFSPRKIESQTSSPMMLRDWCPYEDVPAGFQFDVMAREEAPGFFESTGELVASIDRSELPGEMAFAVGAAGFCHRVAADLADPPDLGYLQFAWAVARWFLEQGATAILDPVGERWFDREEVMGWPGGRKFSIAREARVNSEPLPDHDLDLFFTRGLLKFGRPDVCRFVPRSAPESFVTQALMALAEQLALGRLLEVGEALSFQGLTGRVEIYHPGENGPALGVSTPAVLLADPDLVWKG